MAMKWLNMDQTITKDEHRWIILYLPEEEPTKVVEKMLNGTGLEVTLLQDAKVAGIAAEGYKAFYGLIEPQIGGLTPNSLKEQLHSPALLISRDGISDYMETVLDLQEIVLGDDVVPTRFLKDDEKALAGSWYMSVGVWSTQALPMTEITNRLAQAGYLAYRPEVFSVSAKKETRSFLFSPGSSNPTVKEIRKILGATSLYVNSYPFEGDVDFLQQAEGQGQDFLKAITAFGSETVGVATAIADAGAQLGKTGKRVLGALEVGLMLAVPLALLGGSFWVYSKYKEAAGR